MLQKRRADLPQRGARLLVPHENSGHQRGRAHVEHGGTGQYLRGLTLLQSPVRDTRQSVDPSVVCAYCGA